MPKSVSPIVIGLEPYEQVLAANQPEYESLVVLRGGPPNYTVLSRWSFTDEERQAIAAGADIVIGQMTFGKLFQPTAIQTLVQGVHSEEQLRDTITVLGLNDELDERLRKILLDK